MTATRAEAIASAKRNYRTLASAPAPQSRAQAIYSELVRAEGWTRAEEVQIIAFGAWLSTRPPPSALKDRCKTLLAVLG